MIAQLHSLSPSPLRGREAKELSIQFKAVHP